MDKPSLRFKVAEMSPEHTELRGMGAGFDQRTSTARRESVPRDGRGVLIMIVVMTNLRPWLWECGGDQRAEIKQNQRAASLEAEAFLSLLRTADQMQGSAAQTLKPHGVSATQYNALRILPGTGAQGLACQQIAERMIHHDPTPPDCWTGWSAVAWRCGIAGERIGG